MIRLGIPVIGSPGWLGGVSYVEHLARSVAALAPHSQLETRLVVRPEALEGLELHKPFLHLFSKIIFVLPDGASPPAARNDRALFCRGGADLFQHVDCLFPLAWDVWEGLPAASWIPDFQHRFLPQFFSPEELASRDRDIDRVAARAKFIVFSSRTAENHFRSFYPGSLAETRVLSFYATPGGEYTADDPAAAARRYGLPERYLLCCNQFWVHKDHPTLFRALALCRDRGLQIPLALTGATQDYRHPQYFESLRRVVSESGLEEVFFLGTVPRADQLQLIRRSCAMVQPSLFEGWSTVVEDGRVYGKRIFLSDLDVHKEQDPAGALFFKAGNPEDLARVLSAAFPAMQPGPDLQTEVSAAAGAREQVAVFARTLEAVAKDSLRLCAAPVAGAAR